MTARPLFDALERPGNVGLASMGPPKENAHEEVTSTEPPPEESSRHLRTQFLRRVAHDIASPAGVTATVLEELATESSRPELVAMARRGLRRLLRLSEQLALVAELEAGSVSPDTTPEDIRALAKDALEQAVAVDGRRDIVTSCDVPDAKLIGDLDRRLLLSVLREVIGNGLRLATSRVAVEVDTSTDGKCVLIRVHDDGPGFSDEVLATLGQRFTSRSCARGLGLSLSMAKDVLAAHGGDLHIEESTLPLGRRGARGAAVVLTLPRL